MDYIKSSLYFITFVFFVTHIECEDDFHLELSVRYNSTAEKWTVDKFWPQLDNALEAHCVTESGKLVPGHESGHISELTTLYTLPLALKGRIFAIIDPQPLKELTWLAFGNCMTGIEQLSYRSKYYSETSRLFNKYNMNSILRQSNITPGKNYTYQEISEAVSRVTQGRKPVLKCLWYRKGQYLILDEITLFFDKSMNLIDPVMHHYPRKCPPDLPILYENASSYSDLDNIMIDFPPFLIYDEPFDKYPTLREDDNGYYLLSQEAYPAKCHFQSQGECQKPKYSWVIRLFTFLFKYEIDFMYDLCGFDPYNHEAKYNFTSLSSIKDEIVDKWKVSQASRYPSEEYVIGDYWKKQGQRSAYFKGLDNEFKFYNKSLELHDKYNMDAILQQSNIVPGNNYTYQQISDAVSKGIGGKQAKLICRPFAKEGSGREILSVIGFYMDKNFNPTNPIDIDNPFRYYSTCNHDSLIFYQDFMNYVMGYDL